MKGFRDIFDQRIEKTLRLGLLLVSALFISSATILFYYRTISEKPLNVGNGGAHTTGSASTALTWLSISPQTVFILVVLAFIISLSMFAFLREAHKHIRISSGKSGLLQTSPGSTPLGKEEWEEAPRKEEESSTSSSG